VRSSKLSCSFDTPTKMKTTSTFRSTPVIRRTIVLSDVRWSRRVPLQDCAV
jgi:hypothetical protein